MAEIILNVDVRDGVGTGSARAARRAGAVPGVLYGGDKAPVAISVNEKDFRKNLYTGKLLGHLVTLKYGKETQPVIAKDVQFDPVSDRPMHFDHDECEAFRQGGSLEIVRHTVEISVRADHIPEELVVDLAGHKMGDTIRISDIKLPKGVEPAIGARDFMVAAIKISSAAKADAADEAADEAAAEAEAEVAADEVPATAQSDEGDAEETPES